LLTSFLQCSLELFFEKFWNYLLNLTVVAIIGRYGSSKVVTLKEREDGHFPVLWLTLLRSDLQLHEIYFGIKIQWNNALVFRISSSELHISIRVTNIKRVSIRRHGQVSYANYATIEKYTIKYKYAASHSYHTNPTYVINIELQRHKTSLYIHARYSHEQIYSHSTEW